MIIKTRYSFDFTDLDQMKKWLDEIQEDIERRGKVETAVNLEILLKYREYFESEVLEETLSYFYLSRQINDLVFAYTQQLIDVTLGKLVTIPE